MFVVAQHQGLLQMITQDIALFSLTLPAIPLNMVAVNFRYTALAGLIRQIHDIANRPSEHSRPPAILHREVGLLQTRITYVKFSLFFAGLSFLFNLLAVGLMILGATTLSYALFIATLASLSSAILLFLYEISRSTEALSLHIADIGLFSHRTPPP